VFSNHKTLETPYILVVQCDNDDVEENVNKHLESAVKRFNVKSKTVNSDGIELTLEVRLDDETTKFVNAINAINGVRYASLVSYNGEYMA